MGRNRKTRILGLTFAKNGNSVYIDFSSKENFEITIKINENKINDIINQINLSKKSPNSQENDQPLIGPSNNNDETNNEKEIESNQKEDLPNIGYFNLIEKYSDNFFSDDLNNEFYDDTNSDFPELENLFNS